MKITSIFFAHKRYFALADELKKVRPDIEIILHEENMEKLPDTDAYFGFFPILDFYQKQYKWVHCIAAGVDKFLEKDMHPDTIFTRTIGQFGYQIGTYVLSYLLADVNLHDAYRKQQETKLYKPIQKTTLKEKTVVVFGTGEIGREIARILGMLEARVLGISRSGKQAPYFDAVYETSASKEIVKQADYIINIMPLTEETHKYFNTDFFAHCKDTFFVNVGRGKSVDEEALLNALNKQQVRMAILDVQDTEPLPQDSWLWEDNRVVITPHISGSPDLKQGAKRIPQILRKIENKEELDCLVDFSKKY